MKLQDLIESLKGSSVEQFTFCAKSTKLIEELRKEIEVTDIATGLCVVIYAYT